MKLEEYISNINERYKLGNATEHTFRGDLQQLLESLNPEIRATNEPKRQSCGAPDFIITQNNIHWDLRLKILAIPILKELKSL